MMDDMFMDYDNDGLLDESRVYADEQEWEEYWERKQDDDDYDEGWE
jgi:hypothetical protein